MAWSLPGALFDLRHAMAVTISSRSIPSMRIEATTWLLSGWVFGGCMVFSVSGLVCALSKPLKYERHSSSSSFSDALVLT